MSELVIECENGQFLPMPPELIEEHKTKRRAAAYGLGGASLLFTLATIYTRRNILQGDVTPLAPVVNIGFVLSQLFAAGALIANAEDSEVFSCNSDNLSAIAAKYKDKMDPMPLSLLIALVSQGVIGTAGFTRILTGPDTPILGDIIDSKFEAILIAAACSLNMVGIGLLFNLRKFDNLYV